MLLRSPFYIENFKRDQPYNSLLLIVPYCHKQCVGCHNEHLQDNTLRDFAVDELVEIYTKNPFVEGVTLGGLEPMYCSHKWWDEFNTFIIKAKVKDLTIYTHQNFVFRAFSGLDNVYWKTGAHKQGRDKKTITYQDWKLELSSDNQRFFRASNVV